MSVAPGLHGVKSMTGFAKVARSVDGADFDIEVKSVNSRYLEVNLKSQLKPNVLERDIRSIFQKHHSRGRIDVFINRRVSAQESVDASSIEALDPLVSSYMRVCKRYGAGSAGLAQFLASLVLRGEQGGFEQRELTDEEIGVVCALADQVSNALAESRLIEGKALVADVAPRIEQLERFVANIRQHVVGAPERVRERLLARVRQLEPEIVVDKERMALEVALLADRVDVTEELSRLGIHLGQFIGCLSNPGPQGVGRKLDFLTQEIGRELNTVGSKAQDAVVQGFVVDAKAELEKIREQVQNIE